MGGIQFLQLINHCEVTEKRSGNVQLPVPYISGMGALYVPAVEHPGKKW